MDPQPLSTAEWAELGNALMFLWGALGFSILAGTSLLTAHALITSLVDTNTIPAGWSKIRPILYVTGIAAVVGLVACLFLASQNLGWLEVFYPRYWQ